MPLRNLPQRRGVVRRGDSVAVGMSKYAPAREDGLKAYVVSEHSWGRTTEWVKWAETLKDAKAKYGWTRQLYTSRTVRRATPADVEELPHGL